MTARTEATSGPLGEPVELPWRVLPDYQCFGCSPANDKGLRLRFVHTADGGIECAFTFDRAFESYPGVVHGGMSTTICDEIMGNLLVLRLGVSVFTTSMRTRYVEPLAIGASYRCTASTEAVAGEAGPHHARAEITDAAGNAVVFATGAYQPVTEEQARKRMAMSEREARLVDEALAELRSH
ncbi:PaaI family thioesterase [Streptomyces sp. JJ38]|uniref:PaaI family thioesterase n=1 Tax=Streptomyces sp. JJ38 TaxID=2738128 RepID=UPI001C576A8A|nr:PaaI family thioesterase [Streptomyces sp. JJ38]MBW1598032.1 PaaI family thioesterase [Streptomyces sp. JJ38]